MCYTNKFDLTWLLSIYKTLVKNDATVNWNKWCASLSKQRNQNILERNLILDLIFHLPYSGICGVQIFP